MLILNLPFSDEKCLN
uniref:Uncharacterized protein n=1 Tax=Rhizophora mucronata TaxID=61149 RepID=A0A2P2PBD4_RHIMU